MTKANKPHPPEVSMAILRQVPTVTLSLWSASRGYNMEVEVGLCLHHSVDVFAQYGAHPYQHPVTMLTPFTSNIAKK